MVLRNVERGLERLVEGAFARAFRSGLQSLELGRRMLREIDGGRPIGVHGRTLAPNRFDFALSPEDHARLAGMEVDVAEELRTIAVDHIKSEGYTILGPITVGLAIDERRRPGSFTLKAVVAESAAPGQAMLVFLDREPLVVDGALVSIGRLPDCGVQVIDPNVSRRHAEIHATPEGHVLVDLGSTNGSRVNGRRVSRHLLANGDELGFGGVTLVYRSV